MSKVNKKTRRKGLMILKIPLSVRIVDSSIKMEKIGESESSPGILNQIVPNKAKEKLNNNILNGLFEDRKDIKKEIEIETKKYKNQKKIIRNLK